MLGMLTTDQRDEFDRTGLLRLSGVTPVAAAHAMADRIWSFLSRQSGVDRHDPVTWSTTQPTGFQPVSRAGSLTVYGAISCVLRSLRVVEATGNPGDVYLMHSDCFHAVAADARTTPRIMATSVVSGTGR